MNISKLRPMSKFELNIFHQMKERREEKDKGAAASKTVHHFMSIGNIH